MPELTSADVELYTKGRLSADKVETFRALQRAYAAVRTYCLWHVTPVKSEVVTLDGSGDIWLGLPTRNLVTLTSVVEDGVTLNVADLVPSQSGRILIKKPLNNAESKPWSSKYRSITVTMTHGFVTAPDFDLAVLGALDYMTLQIGVGGLRRYRVDDVDREWLNTSREEYDSAINESLLEQYRLIPPI